jgi:hypothetical protein
VSAQTGYCLLSVLLSSKTHLLNCVLINCPRLWVKSVVMLFSSCIICVNSHHAQNAWRFRPSLSPSSRVCTHVVQSIKLIRYLSWVLVAYHDHLTIYWCTAFPKWLPCQGWYTLELVQRFSFVLIVLLMHLSASLRHCLALA